jgi:hypothetical protein
VRIPSRSHSKRWNCEIGKSLAKDSSSKSQGRIKSLYGSRDNRFGGSSYGARISRSSSKRIFWTASALNVDGSEYEDQWVSSAYRSQLHIDPNTSHSRQYNDEQVHKATVPPDLAIREASFQN